MFGGRRSVHRLYLAGLGRAPDSGGLQHWVGSDLSLREIAVNIAESPEFTRAYGAVTNRDFVARLYATALHRTPEPSGQAYWAGLLDRGTARSAVVLQVANSYELAYRLARATAG